MNGNLSTGEDNFQKYLNEQANTTSTILLPDDKVDRMTSLLEKNRKQMHLDLDTMWKTKGFSLKLVPFFGSENELCVPTAR